MLALLQGGHAGMGGSPQELVGGIAHGVVLGSSVLMCGLPVFVAAVWIPACRSTGFSGDTAGRTLVRVFRLLVVALVVSGIVELCIYAARVSGGLPDAGVLVETLLWTRVGNFWLLRFALAVVAVVVASRISRGRTGRWWLVSGVGMMLLLSITQVSHAAAEGRFLPFLSDWLHMVSAATWTGGLLGFPVVISAVMFGTGEGERKKLFGVALRRFSRIAMASVLVLVATGTYALLLHIPSVESLATPYGNALLMKLGLAAFALGAGGLNLIMHRRAPFNHMISAELALALCVLVATGFLTSLPPP